MLTMNLTSLKNSILSAISSAMGAGGTIEVQDASSVVLAVLTGVTFGTPSSGSMSVTATADSSNDASGTGNKLVFKTSGGTVVFTAPSGDLTWSPSSTVTATGTMTLTTATLTA